MPELAKYKCLNCSSEQWNFREQEADPNPCFTCAGKQFVLVETARPEPPAEPALGVSESRFAKDDTMETVVVNALPEQFDEKMRGLISSAVLKAAQRTEEAITGGVKHDGGKLPLHLVPWDAVTAVAEVLQMGAAKYGDRNWELGIDFERLFAADLRHKLDHLTGSPIDEESGKLHLAHAACNALMALALELRREEPPAGDAFEPLSVREARRKIADWESRAPEEQA